MANGGAAALRGPAGSDGLPAGRAEELARALAEGAVMAYPTETSYALGGNALSERVVAEVMRLKRRGAAKALPLLVDGEAGLEAVAREVSPQARRLMASFWPGPLTLVVHAAPSLPAHLHDARGTVAVRWSPHPTVAALLRLGGVPLIGTSANRGGRPPATTARQVGEAFGPGAVLIVDGGTAPGGPPSTVLDTTTSPMRLLREGPITLAQVRDVVGTAIAMSAASHGRG